MPIQSIVRLYDIGKDGFMEVLYADNSVAD